MVRHRCRRVYTPWPSNTTHYTQYISQIFRKSIRKSKFKNKSTKHQKSKKKQNQNHIQIRNTSFIKGIGGNFCLLQILSFLKFPQEIFKYYALVNRQSYSLVYSGILWKTLKLTKPFCSKYPIFGEVNFLKWIFLHKMTSKEQINYLNFSFLNGRKKETQEFISDILETYPNLIKIAFPDRLPMTFLQRSTHLKLSTISLEMSNNSINIGTYLQSSFPKLESIQIQAKCIHAQIPSDDRSYTFKKINFFENFGNKLIFLFHDDYRVKFKEIQVLKLNKILLPSLLTIFEKFENLTSVDLKGSVSSRMSSSNDPEDHSLICVTKLRKLRLENCQISIPLLNHVLRMNCKLEYFESIGLKFKKFTPPIDKCPECNSEIDSGVIVISGLPNLVTVYSSHEIRVENCPKLIRFSGDINSLQNSFDFPNLKKFRHFSTNGTIWNNLQFQKDFQKLFPNLKKYSYIALDDDSFFVKKVFNPINQSLNDRMQLKSLEINTFSEEKIIIGECIKEVTINANVAKIDLTKASNLEKFSFCGRNYVQDYPNQRIIFNHEDIYLNLKTIIIQEPYSQKSITSIETILENVYFLKTLAYSHSSREEIDIISITHPNLETLILVEPHCKKIEISQKAISLNTFLFKQLRPMQSIAIKAPNVRTIGFEGVTLQRLDICNFNHIQKMIIIHSILPMSKKLKFNSLKTFIMEYSQKIHSIQDPIQIKLMWKRGYAPYCARKSFNCITELFFINYRKKIRSISKEIYAFLLNDFVNGKMLRMNLEKKIDFNKYFH